MVWSLVIPSLATPVSSEKDEMTGLSGAVVSPIIWRMVLSMEVSAVALALSTWVLSVPVICDSQFFTRPMVDVV